MGRDGFSPGDVIVDKYRIVRTIGKGGMGVVLAADHLQLGKTVAVKILKGDANQISLARFSREARAVAQIASPHVCQVFDVGVLPDGDPFMVMELMEGSDLAQLSKQGHVFPVEQVVDYILQACEALAEAHSKDIIHRDLKPGNLFLAKQPNGTSIIKLLDFGISKTLSGPDHGLTQTDAVVGSPRFMAPEQLKSAKDVDQRADIWSLGVLTHELLTGKAAFAAGTIAELFIRIIQEDPEPLREQRPDVPPGLDRVINKCLEKEREERYENVAELALALAPYGSAAAKTSCDTISRVYEATGWSRSEPAADDLQPQLMGTMMMDTGDETETVAKVAGAVTPATGPTPDPAAAPMAPAPMAPPVAAPQAAAPLIGVAEPPPTGPQQIAAPAGPASAGVQPYAQIQTTDGVAGSPRATRSGSLAPKLAAAAGLAAIGAAVLVWTLVDSDPPTDDGSPAQSAASEPSTAPIEPDPAPAESAATTTATAAATAEPAASLEPTASATAPTIPTAALPPTSPPSSPPKAWPPKPPVTSQPKTPKDRIGF